jgi:anthranilate synthase component II
VDYFNQLGVEAKVFRNDRSLEEITSFSYSGVVLSPGPENPKNAGCLMKVVDHFANKLPLIGICLGHQALGQYFGANLVKAARPMHGKMDVIQGLKGHIFDGISEETDIVRYHSLILEELPDILKPIAHSANEELMAFEHKKLPITGLQFHPEAVLTNCGLKMLSNWISFNNIV